MIEFMARTSSGRDNTGHTAYLTRIRASFFSFVLRRRKNCIVLRTRANASLHEISYLTFMAFSSSAHLGGRTRATVGASYKIGNTDVLANGFSGPNEADLTFPRPIIRA